MTMPFMVPYTLNAASQYWVAPGRASIAAPPFVPPPDPPGATVFLLDDPNSVLDGPKVLS